MIIKGINRVEITFDENTQTEIIDKLQKEQNKNNVPIYVINKNQIWYSTENRNIEKPEVRFQIDKNTIPEILLNIILHNDKTGKNDNISRLEYILDATNALLTHKRGIVALPTGAGKSLIIALLVQQMQKEKILIIAPSLVICEQIKALLNKVGIGKNIDVFTHLTASKIEPDKIGEKAKYHCIIFDECHKMSCNSYIKSLFRSETTQIYGLSASISKYGSCSSKFHIGPLVYELPYSVARTLTSSINAIQCFHKFEFGKKKSEKMNELITELEKLEMNMNREIFSLRDVGWVKDQKMREIRARYVNMGFLLAEKNEERNRFIGEILQAISKKGLLNITFLRTKECGRLVVKMMPPRSTLFWCGEGIYIYEGGEKLKRVDYEYVFNNFGKDLNNILATSCLQMGANLQFTHGTINSILLLSGSTHNSLAQQIGRAVRCNPSSLPARAHTIIDKLPLLETNANNRIKDLNGYFSLDYGKEILHTEEDWRHNY